MDNIVLISIKPKYSNLIFDGTKKIELRKSKPSITPGDIILIYNTQPEKAVVGFCRLKSLITLSPDAIWKKHSTDLGISFDSFNEYYEGRKLAIGLEVEGVRKFDKSFPLSEIKKEEPKFSPPQTFKYFTSQMLTFLDKNSQKLMTAT